MVNVTARIRIKGKHYEILVDQDKAIALKRGGQVSMSEVLATDSVFLDMKKGDQASSQALDIDFGTSDVYEIAEKIIKNGEIEITQGHRDEEREKRIRRIIDFLSKNAVDPRTDKPHSTKTLEDALDKSGVSIDNRPVEQQISRVLEKLRPILPIKVETKTLKITIPAVHTGKAYGILKEYAGKEEWLSNGDLQVIIKIPIGLQMDFYDKLNAVTHGSAVSEEIKDGE